MTERLKGYLVTPTYAVFPFALFGHLGFDTESGTVDMKYRAEILQELHPRKKESI